MELLVLGLIVLIFYGFIRLLASFGGWWSGARFRAYRHLASRFKGRMPGQGRFRVEPVKPLGIGGHLIGASRSTTGSIGSKPWLA